MKTINKENMLEISKSKLIEFYDELSRVLTEWECSEISDFELYAFMVELHKNIAEILN
jgi:hypothetical protein